MTKDSEKVIVIGTNNLGETTVSCQKFTTDKALVSKMKKQYSCDDFLVMYEENIPELEDALNEFYGEDK